MNGLSMTGIGLVVVEVFVETLGHTISYSRLMALGLIHSAMSSLFLMLGGLVVFVHTLRLHWVEWFSEFYTGEGILFKPFKFT